MNDSVILTRALTPAALALAFSLAPSVACVDGSNLDAGSDVEVTVEPDVVPDGGSPSTAPDQLCDRSGRCQDLLVPEDPICYTPCTNSFTSAAGDWIECTAEGLRRGCLGTTSCEQGSCVAPTPNGPTALVQAGTSGIPYPGCAEAGDCPDFQTCIEGRCYSTCEDTGDCPADFDCYRQVCRLICGGGGPDVLRLCPLGGYCESSDGTTGRCMPVAEQYVGDVPAAPLGGMLIERTVLEFSNVVSGGTFVIHNQADQALDFEVTKVEHSHPSDTGLVIDEETPMFWLSIGALGAETTDDTYSVLVEARGQATVSIVDADNDQLSQWSGSIEVSNAQAGTRTVTLTYNEVLDGRWAGEMIYFASFPDGGLANWTNDRNNYQLLELVGNAFMQRWGGLKAGLLNYDEFRAMVESTRTGSWRWPSMDQYCPDENVACYLYDNAQGFKTFSDSLTQYPVPSGLTELPLAINLRTDAADTSKLVGAIDSERALHYMGRPEIEITLAGDPRQCANALGGVSTCDVTDLRAEIITGGRYATTSSDVSCALGPVEVDYELTAIPWLVPGLGVGVETDPETATAFRYECRDTAAPFGAASAGRELNISVATANPIPDGRARRRQLELVDGILVNGDRLVIIFREHFESFLGAADTEGFSAYGMIDIERTPAALESSDFAGAPPPSPRTYDEDLLGVGCSAEVLTEAIGQSTLPVDPIQINRLAEILVDGVAATASPTPLDAASVANFVHYYCEDTGLLNGGPGDAGGPNGASIPCPAGSRVQYFISTWDRAQVAADECQTSFSADATGKILSRGTCAELLAGTAGRTLPRDDDPVWRCEQSTQAYCSLNRYDLRADKLFYAAGEAEAVYLPIRNAVASAFRYKTRFRNRNGQTVGFAPQICQPNSDQVPYCYDPGAIAASQARIDCALYLYTQHFDDLEASGAKITLQAYLTTNFSYEEEVDPTAPLPIIHDGFERLSAELAIMLGDESYTRAFSARFDLAGQGVASFLGSQFEPNGIDLAGGAGFEMFSLYQAVQYYQMTLDRFYAMSPLLWIGIDSLGADDGFISKEAVVAYFDRLIRASSQKARAWSEAAALYQSLNRPDLARLVVMRAYTAAYLESVVLSRMMLELESVVLPEDRPQILKRVELAQLTYRSALLRMQDQFQGISDTPSLFGFDPDYIPFPAVADDDANAFQKVLSSAQTKLGDARSKEEIALASTRSFDTDALLFQSELVELRNNYENELTEICGTFAGDDGQLYPALPRYAAFAEATALVGDPCGLTATGDLYAARLRVDDAAAELEGAINRYDDVFARIDLEETRVRTFCDYTAEDLEFTINNNGEVSRRKLIISASRVAIKAARAGLMALWQSAMLNKCFVVTGTANGTNCPAAATGGAVVKAAKVLAAVSVAASGGTILIQKAQLQKLENGKAEWEAVRECEYAAMESSFLVRGMLLEVKNLDLEVLQAQIQLKLALGEAVSLRNEATRLISERQEVEELTINVEAARNDPNVRIYKNDAILNADRTFESAVRAAYKATKVYEYYTTQSYAYLGDLFLIRMISAGDHTLESYLAELEDSFGEFEEEYGLPDRRVQMISLRDDILKIPRTNISGEGLAESARNLLLVEALSDPSRLDDNGYLTLPFATSLFELSPATRNHKIHAIEAEIVGADVGDAVGRVYLRQRGTGTVARLGEGKSYFLLPARTAVINTIFNGERVFAEDVYSNQRLRDRPFANSRWELVLNQRDETANQDIRLEAIQDIRLFVYYTDFTEF